MTSVRSCRVTFGEWWLTYQEIFSARKARPDADATRVGFVLPKWGKLRLDRITRSMAERHLQSRLQDVTPGTVEGDRGTLQAIFQRAIEDGLIETNPFKGIKKAKGVVRERVLSREEQAKLLPALRPDMQRWCILLLGTGLRIEESRGVTVDHLDRVGRLLTVDPQFAKLHKARAVPLYPEVEQVIDTQAATGRMWVSDQSYYRKLLSDTARSLGMAHIAPHCLRHTYATRYLQAGGNIYILSKILGHAHVSMTEHQYAHLVRADLVTLSKGLDLGLQGGVECPTP